MNTYKLNIYYVFQQIFQGDGNQCWRSVLSDRAGEEDEEPEGPHPCLHRILQHSFTLVNTIDKYDKELPSVPEEIVDNSDLGDPEGMLQLSRVRSNHIKQFKLFFRRWTQSCSTR